MIIALLTDFGTKDYFVGAMKGVILSINKGVNIIDITHEINPQDIQGAGFTLKACYKNFPNKTIFVAVVDPGVGSDRRAILVETLDYFFIAPDNGLLSFVFEEEKNFRVFELTNYKFFNKPVSNTFHGRDIFSPVGAYLSSGIKPEEFGGEIKDFLYQKASKIRQVDEKTLEAEIVHIDQFGNLITNLKKDDLPQNYGLEINGRKIKTFQTHFAEGEKDKLFMIFGSTGFLEIAIFQDSAKKILSAKVGQKVNVKFL